MAENIFLFVPNLIGYARIALAIVSFYFMPTSPQISVFCYLLSGLLDAFDGHAARYLNQGTKFGAMLDMLTDRCATMCLCVVLAMFYPKWALFFQLMMALDISSHWLHMHVSMMKGSESHKNIDLSGNPVLRLYYTSRKFLFFMCAGNELFYAMLYLVYFFEGPQIKFLGLTFGLVRTILYLSAPISFAKSAISLIHLVTASQNVANIDVADRAAAKEKKATKSN